MLTAVDATDGKSRDFASERDPYAVMASGAFGDRDGHRVRFEIGGQLPFTQIDNAEGDRLEMRRWIGSATSQHRLFARDVLVAAVEGETTAKSFDPGAAGSTLAEDFDRTFLQVRLEWWRDVATHWSVGVLHTALTEDGDRPDDPAADLRTRRREWFGVLRVRLATGGRLSFEPQAFAGWVADAFRDGADDRDESRFEGKFAWNTRWDFTPDISLVVILSAQFDEPAFGGGGAQFSARF
ncbi:MAG: hypothetical protein FJ306_08265 [Planctomycetes bacterium]|nr:hypothetical protein [Planctomycetota bacterium]